MTKININSECVIILKKRGVDAINNYYKRLEIEPPEEYKVGDKIKKPMWEIMNIFGEYTFMGPETPFETNIEILELK